MKSVTTAPILAATCWMLSIHHVVIVSSFQPNYFIGTMRSWPLSTQQQEQQQQLQYYQNRDLNLYNKNNNNNNNNKAKEVFSSTCSSTRLYESVGISPINGGSSIATKNRFDSPANSKDINVMGQRPKLDESMLQLPRHSVHFGVNKILHDTEEIINKMHDGRIIVKSKLKEKNGLVDGKSLAHDTIYANTYVDLGKVDTVGFDYDYTLMTYTDELLELIYSMALQRLVHNKEYPLEMLNNEKLQFDPFFSIRGLAVDKETGWICHLSYTHKVAVAWEGREKLPTKRIYKEYRGKRALRPTERKERLKPLNDLFSMAECCLIADTIQFFKDSNVDYCPSNAVTDILDAIRDTHISGDFHRLVAQNPERYFVPAPHLKLLLTTLKKADKQLIFVSNSPFWYVDAGMKFALGEDWIKLWDAVIVSAGKPTFYTDDKRPFREVDKSKSRAKFKKVEEFEPGEVYTGGCLKELTRLMDLPKRTDDGVTVMAPGAASLASSSVLYIGDSLFADLVDAKREYGWITAAVTPEVGVEMDIQSQNDFILVEQTIEMLLNALRLLQTELGPTVRTEEDIRVLDQLERLVSKWRDRETLLLGNPFGSVFRARYQPSLFAHSLRRYCDLYMSDVSSLLHYSPQHRFYPEPDFRLLAHEIRGGQQQQEDELLVLNQQEEQEQKDIIDKGPQDDTATII